MLKTDNNNTRDFQKHDGTGKMKSIWDLEKCLSSWKRCSASLQLKTQRNDGTSRKHEETTFVTPEEHLLTGVLTQILAVRKAS